LISSYWCSTFWYSRMTKLRRFELFHIPGIIIQQMTKPKPLVGFFIVIIHIKQWDIMVHLIWRGYELYLLLSDISSYSSTLPQSKFGEGVATYLVSSVHEHISKYLYLQSLWYEHTLSQHSKHQYLQWNIHSMYWKSDHSLCCPFFLISHSFWWSNNKIRLS